MSRDDYCRTRAKTIAGVIDDLAKQSEQAMGAALPTDEHRSIRNALSDIGDDAANVVRRIERLQPSFLDEEKEAAADAAAARADGAVATLRALARMSVVENVGLLQRVIAAGREERRDVAIGALREMGVLTDGEGGGDG